MEMSLTALRSLLEVSRRGTMIAAAEALGYTPGAVSHHIATLTKAAGTPLVVAVGRRVQLTDAAHVLVEHAARVVASEEEARRALLAGRDEVGGLLRVGTFASSAATLMAPAFTEAAHLYPELTITSREVRETTADNACLAVSRGELDLALGLDYPDAPIPRAAGIELVPLMTETFDIATAPGTTHDACVTVAWSADQHWVLPPPDSQYGSAIRAALRRRDVEPRVTHEVTDTAVALALVAGGLGITTATPMMRSFAAHAEVETHRLDEQIVRQVVLVRRADEADRPSVRALTTLVLDVIDRHGWGERAVELPTGEQA